MRIPSIPNVRSTLTAYTKKSIYACTALVSSLALLLGGCGGSASSTSQNATAGSNAVITAFASEPQNPLVPTNTNETGGGKVISSLFAGLVTYDFNGKTQNEIADLITNNADATQYTVTLKKDWKFTNGEPVTAKSFARAWSYAANVKNAQKTSSFFSNIQGFDALQDAKTLKGDEQLAGIKVVDDHKFTVNLSQPDSIFAIKLGHYAFSPLPDAFYKNPKEFGQNPIGNGAYKFKSWKHGQEINVVKNPDYHGVHAAKNGGITFKIYTDTDAAYADVQAGNLDILESVPVSAIKTFRTDSNVQAYDQPSSPLQFFYIPSELEHFKVNTEEGRLRRQAISMAIDRKSITEKVLGGIAVPAVDFSASTIPGFSNTLRGNDVLKFNPAKAKELWNKAQAIAKYDGEFTFSYNADGDHAQIFNAVINSIKNTLHIKVSANAIPTFQEFLNLADNDQLRGAVRSGWAPDYPSIENYLFQLYASSAADGEGANSSKYKNPEVDELFTQAAKAPSIDKSYAIYHRIEEILLRDLPGIPLYNPKAVGVAARGVKNFSIDWSSNVPYWNITK